jgi:two-component system response regulator YesN
MRGGSFGYITPSLRHWQSLGERTRLSVDANYQRANGEYPFELKNGQLITEEKRINTLIQPLRHMLTLAYVNMQDSGVNEKDQIERVLRYVMRNHSRDITLSQICDHFRFSRSYISHKFKKRTGKSFREYLTDIRLEDAKSLLFYSNLNVTEIAFAVGFENSNYFSNVFKSKVGLSPLAYRKTIGKREGQ